MGRAAPELSCQIPCHETSSGNMPCTLKVRLDLGHLGLKLLTGRCVNHSVYKPDNYEDRFEVYFRYVVLELF